MNLLVYYDNSKSILNIVEKYRKEINSQVYEIETINKVGFIAKIKNNDIPIKRCNLNLMKFDSIILVTPLWNNKIPSPVKRFLEQSTGRIKNIEYVVYNYNKEDKPSVFDEMDKILNLRRNKSYFVTLNKKEINVRVYQ